MEGHLYSIFKLKLKVLKYFHIIFYSITIWWHYWFYFTICLKLRTSTYKREKPTYKYLYWKEFQGFKTFDWIFWMLKLFKLLRRFYIRINTPVKNILIYILYLHIYLHTVRVFSKKGNHFAKKFYFSQNKFILFKILLKMHKCL